MKPFTPRPCQFPIINQIVENPRCAVWANMGLGKTSGVLAALEQLNLVEDVYPALVIAPLRVARSTWSDEVAKWEEFAHIDVQTIIGSEEQRAAALRRPADIYTINYENLPWLIKLFQSSPMPWPFKTIIADESTKLKGFRMKQGAQRAGMLGRVAHQTPHFINLTGTPSPNGLKDLWGQTWFLDGGIRLGRSYGAFESRWFAYQRIKDAVSHKSEIKPIILPNAQEQIEAKLKDICVSVNAADYFDIKEPIITPVYVDLPPDARAIYNEMEKKLFIELEGHEIEAFNAATKTMKLLQLANGAAYIDPTNESDTKERKWVVIHDEKLHALEDIIEEAAGMPVIVAYQFKSDLARLKKHFPHGRLLNTKQDEDDFKAGKIDLLFAHPKSASHGIDGFQYVTNTIALFGHDWNLEDYMQIIERIGPVRQMQAGLDRPVFIYPIIARDTMDEVVMERRAGKREVQDLLLEAMKRRKV